MHLSGSVSTITAGNHWLYVNLAFSDHKGNFDDPGLKDLLVATNTYHNELSCSS